MPSLAPPQPASLLGSTVSQAAAVNAARARLLSSVASLDSEDVTDAASEAPPRLARSVSSASSATSAAHSAACESCAQLETDFAAAVLFVESYQGPHRILKEATSTPKKDFYAYYQQATLGPCTTSAPPAGRSKLEVSKWEKWRNLGAMTRQEAMKRYTTALDNLVDDWRRSANVRSAVVGGEGSPGAHPAVAATATATGAHQPPRRATSMFERLPRIYDELGELQERVEDESKKRDELEAHVLHFTRENRAGFSQQLEQVEHMRRSLTALVQTLEGDVEQHATELQRLARRQRELGTRTDQSVLLAAEARVGQVLLVLRRWTRHRSVRAALVVLFLLRAWRFLRRHRLPQLLARVLINWLAKVSSLDGPHASTSVLQR